MNLINLTLLEKVEIHLIFFTFRSIFVESFSEAFKTASKLLRGTLILIYFNFLIYCY